MNRSLEKNNIDFFNELERKVTEANRNFVKEVIERQPTTFEQFTQIPITAFTNFHNIIVSKAGEVIFQNNFEGIDPSLYWPEQTVKQLDNYPKKLAAQNFPSDKIHAVRSVTKSVIGILLIKALKTSGKGLTLESPVSAIFPELSAYYPIKICDILNMAVPMDWDEQSLPYTDAKNPERKMVCSDNQYLYSLNILKDWLKISEQLSDEQKKSIGKVARYNSSMTVLSAFMIERITGKDVAEYANDVLFAPLGIEYIWERLRHSDIVSSSSGLYLSPNNMLKIGQSLLNDWLASRGEENPQDILSLVKKFSVTSNIMVSNLKYGLQFWIPEIKFFERKEKTHIISMIGIGGNRISILPSEQIICVMTGGNYSLDGLRNTFPDKMVFKDFIFPACGLSVDLIS